MSGPNDVKEDFLDEDNEIPGQRYVLLSFLSPEKVLARKDIFFFEQFMKQYEVDYKTKNLEKFLAKQVMDFNTKLDAEANRLEAAELAEASQICRQSRIPVDHVLEQYHDFVKQNQKEFTYSKIKEAYDDFMYTREKKLEDEFFAKNNFQTTMRGLKVRGSYGSQEEATGRAKKLQRNDPLHNIYVAEVGKWLAWDPNPHNVAEQEYQNEQLNSLMRSYKENEEQREQFFKENPDAKKAAASKGRGIGPKEVMSVVDGEVTSTSNAAGGGPTAAGGQHAALFDGPADLALQRKLEREGKKE